MGSDRRFSLAIEAVGNGRALELKILLGTFYSRRLIKSRTKAGNKRKKLVFPLFSGIN